jgi:hypothetical protein
MLRLLIAAYFGGWVASAAPFYTTTKVANPNQPIRNILKAFGLSAVWFFSVFSVGTVLVQDLITRFQKTTTTGATGATGPTAK